MVTHTRQALVSAFGYFFETQPFKEEHLDRLSLRIRQGVERFICKATRLLKLKTRRRPKARIFVNSIYFCLVVEVPHQQVIPPVDTAAIGVLQKPHFKSASAGVKLCRPAVGFQEN